VPFLDCLRDLRVFLSFLVVAQGFFSLLFELTPNPFLRGQLCLSRRLSSQFPLTCLEVPPPVLETNHMGLPSQLAGRSSAENRTHPFPSLDPAMCFSWLPGHATFCFTVSVPSDKSGLLLAPFLTHICVQCTHDVNSSCSKAVFIRAFRWQMEDKGAPFGQQPPPVLRNVKARLPQTF